MTNKSEEMLNESLSALVDGESSELDLARLLKETSGDNSDHVLDTWRRYHLAGEVIRGENRNATANLSVPSGFSAGVMAAIDAEETVIAEPLDSNMAASAGGSSVVVSSGWSHRLGQVAVAASVALAVLVGFQYVGQDKNATPEFVDNSAPISTQQNLPGATVPEGFNLPSLSARTVSSESFSPGSQEEQELRESIKQLNLLRQARAQGLSIPPQARLEGVSVNPEAVTK